MELPEAYRRLLRDRDDSLAWTTLVTYVRRLANRMLWGFSPEDVDDCVSQVSLRVVEDLARASGAAGFRGFTISHLLSMRNELIRQRGHLRRVPLSTEHDGVPAPSPELQPELSEEILAALRHCVGQLPEQQRHAVELRYFGKLHGREFAERLGTTEGNSRTILSRGVSALRECLAQCNLRIES